MEPTPPTSRYHHQPPTDFFSQKETGNSDSSYAQKMGFGFWKTYIDKWV